MKLSLKKALSLVVVSAMLVAALAVSVFAAPPAIAADIKLTSANDTGATVNDIIVWTSANADDTAPTGYNWWYKALLEYDDTAKTFKVIETEAMGQEASVYSTWKLGYGRIVIMAHDTNTADTASFSAVSKLSAGKSFFFVGDYDEVLAATGAITVTLTPTEPVGGGYWVKPYKHTFTDGFNIYGDTNTKIFRDDAATGLVDGNWLEDATAFGTEGVYLVQNIDSTNINTRPVVTLAYKYAEATSINTIKIGFYGEFSSMIGLPENDIVISTSEDGENWTEVATLQHGLTLAGDVADLANAEKGTKIATLTLEEAVTATYIKADLVYAPSPFTDKVVWEFIALTEVEFAMVEAEEPAPDYSAKPFFVTHYNNGTAEGAGVIYTDTDTAGAWWHHIAFAPVEGADNAYEIVEIVLGDKGEGVALTIPEGGFVYGVNAGNNWKDLCEANGVTGDGSTGLWYDNEFYASQPNYVTELSQAGFAAPYSWKVGDKYAVIGIDLEGLTVPTTTPELQWYEEGYVCTATIVPYVKYDETLSIDDKGTEEETDDVHSYAVANGFTFTINGINGTIAGEDTYIIDSADAYATCNPNWAISVQLRPTEDGLYEVVRVIATPGSPENAAIEWEEGDIVLVVHSNHSGPKCIDWTGAEITCPNYQAKIAAVALKAGDKLNVTETEAYVLMPGEVIETDDGEGEGEGEGSEGDDVKPGDASNMIVFAILALVAIAGSAVVIKSRK